MDQIMTDVAAALAPHNLPQVQLPAVAMRDDVDIRTEVHIHLTDLEDFTIDDFDAVVAGLRAAGRDVQVRANLKPSTTWSHRGYFSSARWTDNFAEIVLVSPHYHTARTPTWLEA